MQIKELKTRPATDQDDKLRAAYSKFEKLIMELQKRELPEEVASSINKKIDQLNSNSESGKEQIKQIRKTQSSTLKLLEKELKWVPKNHYRNTWLAVGMAAFGIPMGFAFGASMGDMAFSAIGLPVGMVIGIAVGSGMDKKALEEGRQLDLTV